MTSGLGTETFEDDVAGGHGPLDFGNGVTSVRQGRAAANHLYFDNASVSAQNVPEPSTIALLGLGAALWRWRARGEPVVDPTRPAFGV